AWLAAEVFPPVQHVERMRLVQPIRVSDQVFPLALAENSVESPAAAEVGAGGAQMVQQGLVPAAFLGQESHQLGEFLETIFVVHSLRQRGYSLAASRPARGGGTEDIAHNLANQPWGFSRHTSNRPLGSIPRKVIDGSFGCPVSGWVAGHATPRQCP